MSDANALRSLRCPNCGAPLDFAPGQTSARCKFCDSVVEHSPDAMTAADQSRVISTNPTTGAGSGAAAGQARRYIIKMRDGLPVVIESSDPSGGAASPMDAQVQAWQSSLHSSNVGSLPVISPPIRQSSSRLGCIMGTVIALAAVMAIGSAVTLGFFPAAGVMLGQLLSGNVPQAIGTAGTLGARIVVGRSGTLIPGANDGPAEAILLTTQYPTSGGTSETRLVAASTTTHKLLWQTAPLDKNLYDTPILANTDYVFILNTQQLMAIRRTDGTVAWQDTTADKVSFNLCKDCVRLVSTHVIVLSDDGTLQAYDAATGKAQWQARSKQDSPRGLYLLGQRVAFMDRNPGVKGSLRAFDVATGKETSVQPTCQSADGNYTVYADWITPLIVSPKGTDFYMFFGSNPQCAQRWDAQSLKMVWSTPIPDHFSASLDGLHGAFSTDSLYLANDSDVLALALDGGDAHIAVTDPDYRFEVLATHGDDVIVQAKNQRGTTRYELWAVNGVSAEPHWKFDLGENKPLDPGGIIDDNQPVWLAQAAADGLRVVRFQSAADNKSYKLLTDTVNWDTGESAGQKSAPLNIDTIILEAPEWTVWKNDTLWMATNNLLMAFDYAQNKIAYQWP